MSNEIKILIVGAGRIGLALDLLLREEGYGVTIVDKVSEIDRAKMPVPTDVFAAVPYHAILEVATIAATVGAHFYDFTENINIKERVREIYLQHYQERHMPAIITGCGVAPGMTNIIAAHLVGQLLECKKIHVSCGGVPINRQVNPLGYYNIWSLEGLWGLYFGEAVRYKTHGEVKTGKLGDGLRPVDILGKQYEAFYTGGNTIDSLFHLATENATYSTVRHLGHLKKILELDSLLDFKKNITLFQDVVDSLPKDNEDETLIHVEVYGTDYDGHETLLAEEKLIKPYKGISSMQHATARGGIIAMHNVHTRKLHGFIPQEDLEILC